MSLNLQLILNQIISCEFYSKEYSATDPLVVIL